MGVKNMNASFRRRGLLSIYVAVAVFELYRLWPVLAVPEYPDHYWSRELMWRYRFIATIFASLGALAILGWVWNRRAIHLATAFVVAAIGLLQSLSLLEGLAFELEPGLSLDAVLQILSSSAFWIDLVLGSIAPFILLWLHWRWFLTKRPQGRTGMDTYGRLPRVKRSR